MKIRMIIATYDEVASIQKTVAEGLSVPGVALVTIVDGESPNGTAAEVLAARAADRYVELIGLGKEAVCGKAVRLGLWRSIAGNCSYVANMDSDGPHFASDTPLLVNAVSGADLVIGPRWCEGRFDYGLTRISTSNKALLECIRFCPEQHGNPGHVQRISVLQCKIRSVCRRDTYHRARFCLSRRHHHPAEKIRRQDFRSPHPVSSPPSRPIQAVVCHGGGSNSHRCQPRGGKPDTAGCVSCLLK